ncbi:MAG TPA: S24 family peptidase [Crocinitomicaceae bacterium]|nr:S24 family peptidase [Crocinitomicaceae bacterium]
MSVKERVEVYAKSLNMSKKAFEEAIGVSNGYINSIHRSIGIDKIQAIIENFPEINIDWLLTGRGEMYIEEKTKSQITQDERLEQIRKYTAKLRADEEHQTITNVSKEENKGIPLLPFDAFAGIGDATVQGVNFDTIEERYVIPLFDGLKIDFMMPVRGSSMYPKYSSGDVVACRLVEELLFVQWNKVYVVDTISQGIVMKRLLESSHTDRIICRSDNKDYGDFEVPKDDIRNIALVVGVIRLE